MHTTLIVVVCHRTVWYRADYFQTLAANNESHHDSHRPAGGFDTSEPGTPSECSSVARSVARISTAAVMFRVGGVKGDSDPGTNHTLCAMNRI
jgi:hypothetical protein